MYNVVKLELRTDPGSETKPGDLKKFVECKATKSVITPCVMSLNPYLVATWEARLVYNK